MAASARNPDGTYHLGRVFEQLTGGLISSEETMWMAYRLRDLISRGKSKEEAKAIVAEEAKSRPWVKA